MAGFKITGCSLKSRVTVQQLKMCVMDTNKKMRMNHVYLTRQHWHQTQLITTLNISVKIANASKSNVWFCTQELKFADTVETTMITDR